MMGWLFTAIAGIIIGLVIVALSQNEKTAESTKIFTDDTYLEENFKEVKKQLQNKFQSFIEK